MELSRASASATALHQCRHGTSCHTVGCRFNHPRRAHCRHDRIGCLRVDCYYNHKVLICKLNLGCTKKACPYRHVPASALTKLAIASTPSGHREPSKLPAPAEARRKSTHTAPTAAKKYPAEARAGSICRPSDKPNEEVSAIARHKFKLAAEKQKLTKLSLSHEFNKAKPGALKTAAAYRLRIQELEAQLRVFHQVKLRASWHLSKNEFRLQRSRELYRLCSGLPALGKRVEIETCVDNETSRFLIVQGETGSGKSTQIVQYLADLPLFRGKRIVCTQPRKIAAVSLANRVAFEYAGGSDRAKPGFQIGFQVGGQRRRFNRKLTRIEFVTEGIMLERIIAGSKEPFMDVGCIVIDEAHERSVTCDLLLGCFRLEDERWKDIKIVVTSATIDLGVFSAYFDGAPTVEISGRTFPVDNHYCPLQEEGADLQAAVVSCALNIHKAVKQTPGDILCFLPGQDDVQNAKASFEAQVARLRKPEHVQLLKTTTLALYGRQGPEEQAQVFVKLPAGQRKVIFSTDIAETSVTIDGVVYVVDSGVRKEMTFEPKRNISSLKLNQISRGSAIQRAGRAGRTQPGHCYRLYSAEDYERMEASAAPEIFRRPLSLAILSLKEMKIDTQAFQWISAPDKEAVKAAEQELAWLGAVSEGSAKVTELGRLIIQSQQEPKLVRMIQRGCELGLGMTALTIAGVLSVSNLFFWRGNTPETKEEAKLRRQQQSDPDGDVVTIYKLYKQWLAILEGNIHADEGPPETLPEPPVTPTSTDEPENEQQFHFIAPVTGTPPADLEWNHQHDEAGQEQDEVPNAEGADQDQDQPLVLEEEELQPDDESETQSLAPTEESNGASSLQEAVEEIDVELRLAGKKNGRKRASAFCRLNYINGKAVSIIKSTVSELQLIFRNTSAWKRSPSQDREPTSEELNRLVCAGFYLHCARLYQSKSRGSQYYAIFSDTVGKLDYKSALQQRPESQDWIVYDKILQTSLVLFPMAVPIRLEWIEQETCQVNPQLMQLCLAKAAAIPTEKVVANASAAVLRSICGKFFCKLSALEEQLGSNLNVDLAQGTIEVYCTAAKRVEVERVVQEKIGVVVSALESDTVEVAVDPEAGAVGSGTRVLVGGGYKLKEVLFPGEFATLQLRKLPRGCTEKELLHFCSSQRPPIDGLLSINLVEYHISSGATLKFEGKQNARRAFEQLRGRQFQNRTLDITQPELATNAVSSHWLRRGQNCRLIVSWSTCPSTGRAFLTFRTPTDANHVIENVYNLLFGARIQKVHGEKDPTRASDRARVPHVHRIAPRRYKFDTQQPWAVNDNDRAAQVNYVLTVADLPLNIDEQEIREALARVPITPTKMVLTRDPNNKDATPTNRATKELFLRPLTSHLTPGTATAEFSHKNGRAGIWVMIPDREQALAAYAAARPEYLRMGIFNLQPVRLELEHTQWTSIHVNLHKFFQTGIEQVIAYARSRGVFTSTGNQARQTDAASKFESIWFRSPDNELLNAIQARLHAVIAYRAFTNPDRELLFTWTGRNFMEQISTELGFIDFDSRTRTILMYGTEEGQEVLEHQLGAVIDRLKQLECIDQLVVLHTPKGTNFQKTEEQIAKICRTKGAVHWNMVRNRLYITGSRTDCTAIEDTLQKAGLLRKNRKTNERDAAAAECGICFCALDRNFHTTSICGHRFCVECIQPMFETVPPPSVPVACPTCEHPLTVKDVIKFARPEALRCVLDHAVGLYRTEHPELVALCPQPGCNQLLPPGTPTQGSTKSLLHCFACKLTYCVMCTEATGKASEAHPGETCAQSQRGLSKAVLIHLRHVRESIFNNRCPRCKTVWYNFEGCCAVTCGTCKCAFCGICFEDCGSDAHAHVRRCARNPKPGELFLDASALKQAHNAGREQQLRAYLNKLSEEQAVHQEILHEVQKHLTRDLIDLGLNPAQVFAGIGDSQRTAEIQRPCQAPRPVPAPRPVAHPALRQIPQAAAVRAARHPAPRPVAHPVPQPAVVRPAPHPAPRERERPCAII